MHAECSWDTPKRGPTFRVQPAKSICGAVKTIAGSMPRPISRRRADRRAMARLEQPRLARCLGIRRVIAARTLANLSLGDVELFVNRSLPLHFGRRLLRRVRVRFLINFGNRHKPWLSGKCWPILKDGCGGSRLTAASFAAVAWSNFRWIAVRERDWRHLALRRQAGPGRGLRPHVGGAGNLRPT